MCDCGIIRMQLVAAHLNLCINIDACMYTHVWLCVCACVCLYQSVGVLVGWVYTHASDVLLKILPPYKHTRTHTRTHTHTHKQTQTNTHIHTYWAGPRGVETRK